ncbi:hypothetical protein AB832_07675 [Flavobacteriaceae bacterium (ex Bugula neritina AB1)]|nr:hypothetical protein AB832_07675 [Flavobacteriaceae bacterium (ex Bugula neritina AB1)]
MDLILVMLLGGDLLLTIWYRYKDGQKSQPLTSIEYHMTRVLPEDVEDIIKKIVNESDNRTRHIMWEEFRRTNSNIKGSKSGGENEN